MSRRRAEVALLLLYLAFTIVGVLRHEPTRDEAQKWLIARDAGFPSEFFGLMAYEGAPALWPLLLLPLARLGLPFGAAGWLNWALMAAAAAVFCLRAPLPRTIKGLFLFSYFMIFEYAVIGRSYALGLFLLFALLAVYPSRRERPWLCAALMVLLMNAIVLGAIMAAALAVFFLWDILRGPRSPREKLLLSLTLAAGAAVAVAQLAPRGDGGAVPEFAVTVLDRKRFFSLLNYLFPWTADVGLTGMLLLFAAGLALLAFFAVGFLSRPAALLLFLAAVVPPAALFLKTYFGPQWFGFIFVGTVAAAWLAESPPDPNRPPAAASGGRASRPARLRSAALWLAAVPLAVSVGFGLRHWAYDLRRPFSGSKDMAAYIKEHGLTGVKTATHGSYAAALLPYLEGVRYYYLGEQRYGTFVVQDTRQKKGSWVTYGRAVQRAFEEFAGEPRFLMILGEEMSLNGCRLLHKADQADATWGERFYLYECYPPGRPGTPGPGAVRPGT